MLFGFQLFEYIFQKSFPIDAYFNSTDHGIHSERLEFFKVTEKKKVLYSIVYLSKLSGSTWKECFLLGGVFNKFHQVKLADNDVQV